MTSNRPRDATSPLDERLASLASLARRLGAAAGRADIEAALAADGPGAVGATATILALAGDAGLDPVTAEALQTGAVVLDPDVGRAALPFLDTKGAVAGAVEVTVARPRRVDDGAVLDGVGLVVELVGACVRRWQVAGRAAQLAGLAARLAGAVTAADVAAALRDHGAAPVGARLVGCRVLQPGGDLETLIPSSPLPADMAARYRTVPLDAPVPLAEAARRDEAIWITDADDYVARYPSIADDVRESGLEAAVALPLHDASGSVAGVLALGWDVPVRFEGLLGPTVLMIGELAAQALDRATRTDRRNREAAILGELASALQDRLLGAVVSPTGVEIATRYVPAARLVGIGGDWFDVVARPGDDHFTLVIGDVTGHGVDAVATMAQLRTLVAGLLRAGEPLDSLFEQVEAMVGDGERLLASVELFDVDPRTGEIRYRSAGHPWALVRRAGGVVEVLDGAQGALIGGPRRNRPPATVRLDAGDVLVAYTDGLVERRDEVLTDGIQRVSEHLASLDPACGVEAVAAELLAACGVDPAATTLDDDVALVVLRRSTG